MSMLRVGTRGSDLALTQTRWVCDQLRAAHPHLRIEETIIRTHGDAVQDVPFDASWPVGSFVTALERALLENEVDFAVHSYKDLPTASPPELVIAAIPPREAVHDVLVTREPTKLDALPAGFRIGTSSPRRAAQLRRVGDVDIVSIRGNVPTRVAKIVTENLDAVVLAAAGLKRLSITPEHVLVLPPDRLVPAPAQGALAIQARDGGEAASLVRVLDDVETRLAVEAERAFLRGINAGCHTPVGALAAVDDEEISLHAQLFSDDGRHVAEDTEVGRYADAVGLTLARRLLGELKSKA